MDRISTATAEADTHGAGKDGFTDGDAVTDTPPTDLNAAWFNGVQEEILAVVEEAGLVPSSADLGQLHEALFTLFGLKVSSGELIYVDSAGVASPKTRTVFINAIGGTRYVGWDSSLAANLGYIASTAASDLVVLPLSWLREGVTITGLRALVNPNSTGAMTVTLQRFSPNLATPSWPLPTTVASGTTSTSGTQWVDLGVLSESVDKESGKTQQLYVASGQATDFLYGYEITFTDPGPRND